MKNVLIVEDDPMVAMINEEYLSSFQNIKVLGRTFTEKDTLDFLTTHKVDLIILDVFLGEEIWNRNFEENKNIRLYH